MVDKNYKAIFNCPTNKLLPAFQGEAMTINTFFGIDYGDAKLEPFDFTDFDGILFGEIYFSKLNTYWRIKQFVEQNKHNKIIIATGDTKQLKPVQEITNTRHYGLYTGIIIDNIIEYHILIKECKQEDKDKLRNIKTDILFPEALRRVLLLKAAANFTCQLPMPTCRELLHLPTSHVNFLRVTSPANFSCQLFGCYLIQLKAQANLSGVTSLS